MLKGKKILVVIPAYNEEGRVGVVVRGVKRYQKSIDKILVVNDGSTDDTLKEAERTGATVHSFEENKGMGHVLTYAFDYAVHNNYDIVVRIDSDTQDDPKEMMNLIQPIIDEDYDMIQGSRYLGVKGKIPIFCL